MTRVRAAVHGDQRRRRLPPGTLPLAAVVAVDLAVIICLAVRWPPGLLILAAGTAVAVALIGEGADRLSERRGAGERGGAVAN